MGRAGALTTGSVIGLVVLISITTILPAISSITVQSSFVSKAFATQGYFDDIKIRKLVDYSTIQNSRLVTDTEKKSYGVWFNGLDWSHGDGRNVGVKNFFIFRFCTGTPLCSIWMSSGADGSNQVRKLVDLPDRFLWIGDPKIAPSDDSILFKAQYNDNSGPNGTLKTHEDLFKYAFSDKKIVQISDGIPVSAFSWMPNGNIAYIETHANTTCPGVQGRGLSTMPCPGIIYHYNSTIWMADSSDGKQLERLYNGAKHFGDMAVSPDGRKIALSEVFDSLLPRASIWNLTVFDIGKKDFELLAKGENGTIEAPRWTPDGQSILYVTSVNHFVQDRNAGMQSSPAGWLSIVSAHPEEGKGGEDHKVTSQLIFGNSSSPYTALPFDPAISPDGRSVIFGINYDVLGGGLDGPGIYEIDFAKPIPEYNMPLVIMTVGIAGVVAMLRLVLFRQQY
jgi:hypothetical protein